MSQPDSEKPDRKAGWLPMAVNTLRRFPQKVTTAIYHTFNRKEEPTEHPLTLPWRIPKPPESLKEYQEHAIKFSDERISCLEYELEDFKTFRSKAPRVRRNSDPIMDDVVHGGFVDLEVSTVKWVRTYSTPSCGTWNEIPATEKDAFIRQLNGYCVEMSWKELCGRMPSDLVKWAPTLLLQAALAKELYGKILARPFSLFSKEDDDPESLAAGLHSLYEDIREVDVSKANLWRSDMFRLLDRVPEYLSSKHLPRRMQKCSEARCIKFMNGPARHFLNLVDLEPDSTCQRDLEALFVKTGKLSFALSTQRRWLQCYELDELVFLRACGRWNRDKDINLHPFVRSKDDYYGNQVLVLTRPLIRGHGYEHSADGYYQYHPRWNWGAEVYVATSGRRSSKDVVWRI